MAVGDTIPSRDGTPTPFAVGRPESSAVGSRLARMTTPLLPRTSEYQLPTTPANRLRMTSKRNIATLKPIEKPKTPALVAIDDGIRGYRLYTNPAHNSPPTTPYVRNTQLPPLETPLTMQVEKSPPLTRSGAQKNRVTFSSRMLSATDTQDPWKPPRPPIASGGDLRPSTTSTFIRSDVPKAVGRKISDHSLPFGRVKNIRHVSGSLMSDFSLRERAANCIAEDDETQEEDENSFTITGKSGFFRKFLSFGEALRLCVQHIRYMHSLFYTCVYMKTFWK